MGRLSAAINSIQDWCNELVSDFLCWADMNKGWALFLLIGVLSIGLGIFGAVNTSRTYDDMISVGQCQYSRTAEWNSVIMTQWYCSGVAVKRRATEDRVEEYLKVQKENK